MTSHIYAAKDRHEKNQNKEKHFCLEVRDVKKRTMCRKRQEISASEKNHYQKS